MHTQLAMQAVNDVVQPSLMSTQNSGTAVSGGPFPSSQINSAICTKTDMRMRFRLASAYSQVIKYLNGNSFLAKYIVAVDLKQRIKDVIEVQTLSNNLQCYCSEHLEITVIFILPFFTALKVLINVGNEFNYLSHPKKKNHCTNPQRGLIYNLQSYFYRFIVSPRQRLLRGLKAVKQRPGASLGERCLSFLHAPSIFAQQAAGNTMLGLHFRAAVETQSRIKGQEKTHGFIKALEIVSKYLVLQVDGKI